MKLSKSAAGILSARYKSVLIKCLLANLMLFSLPAAAETISNGTYGDESLTSPDGSYLIEGGTFTGSYIGADNDITISDGTFTASRLDANNDITISGGTFTGSELYANNDITISGGTLTNSNFDSRNLIIKGGKIEGTLLADSYDISIDSDAAVVNLTWAKTSATYPPPPIN